MSGLPILDDDKVRAHVMAEMEDEEVNKEEYQVPMQEFMSAIKEGNTEQAIDLFIKLIKKVKG